MFEAKYLDWYIVKNKIIPLHIDPHIGNLWDLLMFLMENCASDTPDFLPKTNSGTKRYFIQVL